MKKWLETLTEKFADDQYRGSFVNYILPDTNESISKMNICLNCENFNPKNKTCKICGCYLPIKTKISFFECPKNKW